MTEVKTRDIPLNWDVFVTPGIPTVSNDLPPGEKRRMWSPISSTLIYGKRDAVLVDTFITVEQADVLVDWVKGSGNNLTTIYTTHGHGDHFFWHWSAPRSFPERESGRHTRRCEAHEAARLTRSSPEPLERAASGSDSGTTRYRRGT